MDVGPNFQSRFSSYWNFYATVTLSNRYFADKSTPEILLSMLTKREFTQRLRRWQRERKKRNRFRQAKQQLCTCITFFCTFFCLRCATATWNCLISRFVEDGNKRQHLSFSFPELWCSPLEFNSKKLCQRLTNLTRWNKCDQVWSNANSLCKWRFRSRRRCGCINSLIFPKRWALWVVSEMIDVCKSFALRTMEEWFWWQRNEGNKINEWKFYLPNFVAWLDLAYCLFVQFEHYANIAN